MEVVVPYGVGLCLRLTMWNSKCFWALIPPLMGLDVLKFRKMLNRCLSDFDKMPNKEDFRVFLHFLFHKNV